jgi:hypothetical protein
MQLLFEPSPYLDGGGKSSRGVKIRCSGCGKEEVIPQGSINLGASSTAQDLRKLVKRFRDQKWQVDEENPEGHLCNACHTGRKQEARMNGKAAIDARAATAGGDGSRPKAAPPPAKTRGDDRRIRDKLDDVYILDKGYSPGWTDQKVADDLHVPVAWVAEIREQSYGDDATNPEIELLIGHGKELAKDIAAVRAEQDALAKMSADIAKSVELLTRKGDELNRRLAQLQEAVGPRRK